MPYHNTFVGTLCRCHHSVFPTVVMRALFFASLGAFAMYLREEYPKTYEKWVTPKNSPNPVFNVPGGSGTDSGGSVHKDKKRTPGSPGGEYENGATHPLPDATDSKITPKRRPASPVGSESSWMPTKPPTAIPSAKTRFQVPALRQS